MDLWTLDYDRVRDHKIVYPEVSKIFEYPTALWYGERNGKKIKHLTKSLTRLFKRIPATQAPVLVLYNMPGRDMGQHSKGGSNCKEDYLKFVYEFAQGISGRNAIVIFEPDSLPHTLEMDGGLVDARIKLTRQALNIIKENCNATVYIDIGHSNWLSPKAAATLLKKVDVKLHRGFAVNVSNYRTTKESIHWATQVLEYLPCSKFVVDTSRNGNGPHGNDWCNPPGRALGIAPTLETGAEGCDGFLWIKVPGESDGKCNNGPRAGKFWPAQAIELIKNSDIH